MCRNETAALSSTQKERENRFHGSYTRPQKRWTELRRTLAARAALVRPHERLGAAGNRAGYQHAHLPARVAVAVTAAVVPAIALLVSPSVRGEAEAGHRRWGCGARNLGAFCTHMKGGKIMGLPKDTGPRETSNPLRSSRVAKPGPVNSGWKSQSIYH